MTGKEEVRQLYCQCCDGADIRHNLISPHLDPLLMLLITDHVCQEFCIFLDLQVLLSQLSYLELVGGKLAHCLAIHHNARFNIILRIHIRSLSISNSLNGIIEEEGKCIQKQNLLLPSFLLKARRKEVILKDNYIRVVSDEQGSQLHLKMDRKRQKIVEIDRRIWVTAKVNYPNPSEDAFLEAKVIDIHPKEIIVRFRQDHNNQLDFDEKTFTAHYENCQKLTYGGNDVPDMVDLEELNQPELLFNLKRRYISNLIFTYCGPTLVIINPYDYINDLFNDQILKEYQAYVFLQSFQYKTLPPHIFGLAAFCLWQLFQNSRNQSIVISGESGAGKTQNTKYCLKYLASLGKNFAEILKGKSLSKVLYAKFLKHFIRKDTKLLGIEDKILGCNEILQAFGNAKTIRNDNSSRFGKLILLLYGESQVDIKSAFIISYLLEKSRIVSVSEGERNYHIFYYFLKGISNQQRKMYMITNKINEFKILNQSSVYSIKEISDQHKFEEVARDFENYFTKQEIHCIFKILSIVLNVGNLQFKKELSKNNEEMASPVNKDCLLAISKLLCVDYEAFSHSFQYKSRKMGQNVINSPLKYDEVIALQNSFSKNLYEKTFIFIVSKLNEKIELEKVNLDETNKSFRKSIGILDIFGFEVLGINSLQQFFINFANEKLQQLYVSYVFKEEQNEFIKEGLKEFSLDIDFQDNKPVIDLFQVYPLGLFHLINQSSQLNKPDQNLPQTICKNHPKNEFLTIPKGKRGIFLINHSCSPVNYSTAGFTNRNKDEFPQQLLDAILNGSDEQLKKIIAGDGKPVETKSRSAAKKFLGSKFLNEMNKLTDQLYSSDCHFVRCIKPNNVKLPKTFNSLAVLQSLRYLGVLDSILIRKLGYIYRRSFKEFLKKFFEIQQYIFGYAKFVENKTQQFFKEYSKQFINKYALNQFKNLFILIGVSKIFIKESALNLLQVKAKEKRKLRIQCATKIKRMCANSIFRSKVKSFLSSIKILKFNLLYVKSKVRENILKKKCTKVQKYIRGYLLEKRMQKIKEQAERSLIKILAYLRMKKCRMAFLKVKRNAIKIQANIRFFLTMSQYFKQKNCRDVVLEILQRSWNNISHKKAVLIQALWRGYITRKKYKKVLEKIKKKVLLTRYKLCLMRVISASKFKLFHQALSKYTKPIIKLQAIVRGKLAYRTYKIMKGCAIVIQKAFRSYLKKKYFLIGKWKDYRRYIYYDECYKLKELTQIGIDIKKIGKIKYLPATSVCKSRLFPQQLFNRYAKNQNSVLNEFVNETIQFKNKNTFQVYIGDCDIIGVQHYKGKWLQKFCALKEQLYLKNEYPIYIHLNDYFTTMISNKDKLYNFFSNQEENLNKRIEIGGVAESISLFDNGGYLLRSDKKMYAWGFNYQNCMNRSSDFQVEYAESPQLSKLQLTDIFCKGQKRYFVSSTGKVHHYVQNSQSSQWKLQILELRAKNPIKNIALSYSFTLFLASNGQIYSSGSNRYGELGLGFFSKKSVIEAQVIPYFLKNKQIIETISVGMGHCVAKSKLGSVYTWGNNNFSQVNNKNVEFIHTPQLLQAQQGKIKACQAVAGYRSTFILTESLRTVGIGTSTSFASQKGIFNLPLELLKQTCNNKQLIEVKISVKWTKELSILFVNAIELTHCKEGTKWDVAMKYAKMISKQWQQNKVYPTYHEWTENVLQLGDLRKFKFDSLTNSNVRITKTEKNRSSKDDIDELKALMNLRKSSTVFKKQALQKMQGMLSKLKQRPESDWNPSQRELYDYITQKGKLLK